jgi:hypothetical protein
MFMMYSFPAGLKFRLMSREDPLCQHRIFIKPVNHRCLCGKQFYATQQNESSPDQMTRAAGFIKMNRGF